MNFRALAVLGISLSTLASTVVLAYSPDPSIGCGSYSLVVERQQRELNQFDKLVLGPLQVRRAQLRTDLDREVNRPKEIEQANAQRRITIAGLNADNQRRATMISNEEQTIEDKTAALETALQNGDAKGVKKLRQEIKDLSQKVNVQKKNTAVAEAQISRLTAVIDEKERERQEILTTPPTASEIQTALTDVETKLMNSADLKNEMIQDLRLGQNAYELCNAYGEKQRQYDDLVRRYDDLFNRCVGPR
jgi:hypothetical protein